MVSGDSYTWQQAFDLTNATLTQLSRDGVTIPSDYNGVGANLTTLTVVVGVMDALNQLVDCPCINQDNAWIHTLNDVITDAGINTFAV